MKTAYNTPEHRRLEESRERTAHWKRWGPYLSERAWGTVREDYSRDGSAWEYFPHDHARSRVYRWNEDGLAGICDRHQVLCFALALWNGRDPILKERAFGLTGNEGNHGEDVKEYYFYLDSTPTHSYMKYLYKYPQAEFPYARLLEENQRRGKGQPEFELMDTGIFDQDRYFDVMVEYAKGSPEDILVRITAANRGPEAATIHLLPTLWFRNTWCWTDPGVNAKPVLGRERDRALPTLYAYSGEYRSRWLFCEGARDLLFTENETNHQRLFGIPNKSQYVKDGICDYIVRGDRGAIDPKQTGTKGAAQYVFELAPGASATIRLRLTDQGFTRPGEDPFGGAFDAIFAQRIAEADQFYQSVVPARLSADERGVMRQAFAGMLWSKQFYSYVIKQWLEGDPTQPAPPRERLTGRNREWTHLYNADVLSMPDAWEYPWYAAWDLAFHCLPLSLVDPDFAKDQLLLLTREWYMHPNGQLPAYEWAFGDVNPPVHAWAAWRIYKIEKKRRGVGDRRFLESIFLKLMINFTWWVNRKDAEGMNLFQGGFLGLDNVGVFDRNMQLPQGGHLEQSDGTSWMAMYCLNLLAIAMELAKEEPAYEDIASKFWEHFINIAHAMTNRGNEGVELWDDDDGFFYDVVHFSEDGNVPMRVRSIVGLIPLFAVETLEPEMLARMPGFKTRLEWFIDNRPDLTANVACMRTAGRKERRLLSIADRNKLTRLLRYMLDENEFLSPYGIRSVSRFHAQQPFSLQYQGQVYGVDYEPAESNSGLFGGNSNWRGPVWFPVNFLLIESLQKFHHYLGDDFKVECPTGSGRMMNLWQVSQELSHRLSRIFLRDAQGRRPVYGSLKKLQEDPHWRDLILFYEYFHGDNGFGLGASHQTGWTGLVAKLLQQSGGGSSNHG